MENRFQLTYNGQAIQQQDVNVIGDSAGLADDRVFAELLRMMPYDGSTVARGILPYAVTDIVAANPLSTVNPVPGLGSIQVHPFRAFIGSRTLADARQQFQDIRSGLSVAAGATTSVTTIGFANNSSGSPRWDLVYAQVNIAAVGSSAVRKVKDVTSSVVTSNTVTLTTIVSVTIATVAGTAAASPVWPAIPVDSGTTYNIPLAYIRIPNGFTITSTIATTDIAMVAPILQLASVVGGDRLSLATSHRTATTANQQSWGSTGKRSPDIWVPSEMVGSEKVIAVVDMNDPFAAGWSHQSGDVVDSRDWRGRICKVFVWMQANEGVNQRFAYPWQQNDIESGFAAFDPSAGFAYSLGAFSPSVMAGLDGDPSVTLATTTGQTLTTLAQTITPIAGTGHSVLFYGAHASTSNLPIPYIPFGCSITLYVDHNDGGKIKVASTHSEGALSPGCFTFWLEFTGPYTNK